MADFRVRFFFLGIVSALVLMASVLAPDRGVASEARVFRLQSQPAFLKGTLDGIGVDSLGTLQLADRAERLVEVGEPFVLSAAPHPDGWVVGTGNAGKVLLIDRSGQVTVLITADEPEIFAVLVDSDGTVFAGSSPEGKVYQFRDGETTDFFEPDETYIWALARSRSGNLLVATGTNGRLYSVPADGEAELLYDSEDTHLRAMKVLSDGGILLGTAGEGLILKIEPDGRPRTLYDAPHPEVVAFAVDPSGTSYAALLASEASLVDLNRQSAAQDSTAEDQDEADQSASTSEPAGQVTITVGPEGAASPVGSRPPGFGGARSEIVRISQQGVVETVTKFKEETIYTLEWQRDRLWVGTGLEGKVYSLKDKRPVLEADVDERQIVRLLEDTPGPAFATTNASALYRFSGGTARTGVYTSPALDSEQIARFGTLRWQGEVPSGSEISFSFRSGMSSDPDRTWTDWSPPESSREISLGGLASGRFVQWRADFQTTNESSPTLTEVTVSYLQANLPPSIDSFKVLDPGQVLVPTNFNPNQLVFEPASPNRQGIFTTLEPAKLPEGQRLKTLWKKGYRTLQWKAEDPNKDDMRYEVSFRPESSISEWMSVAEDLRATYYSFDATSLPDGRYRFHLRAFDRPRDDDADLKTSEEISEPIVVDHSIPVLIDATVHDGEVWVQIYDQWNPIREAEYSADAGEWRPAAAQDGLLDAQRETLVVPLTENGHLMLLRVIDAAFNVVTFDISREIQ